jgi:hypothetical protein
MFEQLKQSLRDALAGGSTPAAVSLMRDALVEAKVAVGQSREARDLTAAQLERERAELETVRRRGELAAQINDAETVAVAARFDAKHTERVAMLERKLAALETEVSLGERDLDEMHDQFREMAAKARMPGAPSAPAAQAGLDERDTEHNALRREAERAVREQDANARLEEMKRKMGRE